MGHLGKQVLDLTIASPNLTQIGHKGDSDFLEFNHMKFPFQVDSEDGFPDP